MTRPKSAEVRIHTMAFNSDRVRELKLKMSREEEQAATDVPSGQVRHSIACILKFPTALLPAFSSRIQQREVRGGCLIPLALQRLGSIWYP